MAGSNLRLQFDDGITKDQTVDKTHGLPVSGVTPTAATAGTSYETVAASQTAQALGATGAIGDYLSHVVFQPTALAAGTCLVLDNAVEVFRYTAGTLGDLRPIYFVANAYSVSGAWKVTTGASMTAVGFGKFT